MATGRLGAGDTAIQPTILDAKGDLIVATAADTPARLAVGSANQVLTVDSSTATGLKWAAPAFTGCALYKNADQTLANVSDTVLTWPVEYLDSDAFHSTSTNTSRITIPSGKGGKYFVFAIMQFASDNTALAVMRVLKNGSPVVSNTYGNGRWTSRTISVSAIVDVVATDFIEIAVYQSSGGNIDASQFGTFCTAHWIGA